MQVHAVAGKAAPAVLVKVEAVRVLDMMFAVGSDSLAAHSLTSTCLRSCTCSREPLDHCVIMIQVRHCLLPRLTCFCLHHEDT